MIKKLAGKILMILILLISFFPYNIFAQDAQDTTPIFTGDPDSNQGMQDIQNAIGNKGITGTDNISDLVLKYVNFSLPFLALGAFLGFVYAGFLYVTAYGNEDQVGKSKKILIYSVVGLIVVILSYSIVQLFTGDLVSGISK